MSTSGGGAGGGILRATAHLTGAQLPTLASLPVTVIPSPGLGKAVFVVGGFEEWKPGLVVYGEQQTANVLYATDNPLAPVGPSWLLMPANGAGGQVAVASALRPNRAALTNTYPLASVAATPIVAASDGDPAITGPIVNFSIANGGTGYAAGDTGAIDVVSGTPAHYTVSTVAPITGAVTLFAITQGDPVYDTLNNPHTTTRGGAQPGVGVGFTVNIDSIPPPDGDLYLTVLYDVVTLH